MKTEIVKVDPYNIDDALLEPCAHALKQGKLVVFPTETVYGLGVNALDENAVLSVYKAKNRPADNPLIVHVANLETVTGMIENIPGKALELMEAFWPGPLALLFPRPSVIPEVVTAGLALVAIRMPHHPIAKRLIEMAGVPLAAPSANISGRPSPTTFAQVFDDLYGKVHYIVDGGVTNIGLESTVLDVSGDKPVILRPGGVTKEDLEKVVGPVLVSNGEKVGPEVVSPGSRYKHYAPRAEVVVATGPGTGQIFKITPHALRAVFKGDKVAVLSSDENAGFYNDLASITQGHLHVFNLGSRRHIQTVAARVYSGLRFADQVGARLVLAETFCRSGLGLAVNNRLEEAGNRKTTGSKPFNVLIVCSGNTCRSPMAKGLLESIWVERGKPFPLEVTSAGTAAVQGIPASPQAIAVMKKKGIDIGGHESKPVTGGLLENSDLVITMTQGHKEHLASKFPCYTSKIKSLSHLASGTIRGDVMDPYCLDEKAYEDTANLLEKAFREFTSKLTGKS